MSDVLKREDLVEDPPDGQKGYKKPIQVWVRGSGLRKSDSFYARRSPYKVGVLGDDTQEEFVLLDIETYQILLNAYDNMVGSRW
jgi:hypothetical protein